MNEKERLIQELKRAIADEWYAFIQYINASAIAAGVMRESVAKDLRENAMEEFEHIDKLNYRIQQLGSLPPLNPAKWPDLSTCGIIVPKSVSTIQLVKDSLEAEKCAIDVYTRIADYCRDIGDHVSYDIIQDILEDEEKHKFEMEQFLLDFKYCLKEFKGGQI